MREIELDKDTLIVSETDEKGIIKYANSDFCKISGFSKDELIGKPHNMVRHPDMPRSAFKDLWDTIKEGRVWNGVVKNSTKEGGFYWVYATIYPSIDVNGKRRYISVRVKPTKEEVEKTQQLIKA
jgi:aerotaxis receptor